MPDTNPDAVKPLSDDEVAEIEAVNKMYRVDWRYPNHRERIDALCATVRALRANIDLLRQSVEDTIALARTEEDKDGFVTAYHFQTGAIHRLLAEARKGNG